jgi:hypothetical protein
MVVWTDQINDLKSGQQDGTPLSKLFLARTA